MQKIISIIFGAVLAMQASAEPLSVIDYKHITNTVMQKGILPGHKLFYEKTSLLKDSITNVCNSNGLVSNAKQAYLESSMTWAGLEWINFGPVMVNDRKMRISFFPDKHNVGSRQLRKAINTQDYALLTKISNGKASYALQGFKALDKILFQNIISKNRYSCAMALAISTNINTIASELNRAWHEEYSQLYGTNVSPEDALENTREILESTRLLLQIMRDHKLGRPLNKGKKVKITSVEYGASGYSLLALKINALVIYKGINSSLTKILSAEKRSRFYTVSKSIIDRIDNAKYPLKIALKKDKPMVKALYNDVNILLILYDKMLNKNFGFKQAFNSLDGD